MSLITLEDFKKYENVNIEDLTLKDIRNLKLPSTKNTNEFLKLVDSEFTEIALKEPIIFLFKNIGIFSIRLNSDSADWNQREIKITYAFLEEESNVIKKHNTIYIKNSSVSCGVCTINYHIVPREIEELLLLSFFIKYFNFNNYAETLHGYYSKNFPEHIIFSSPYTTFIQQLELKNKEEYNKIVLSKTPPTFNKNSQNDIITYILSSENIKTLKL